MPAIGRFSRDVIWNFVSVVILGISGFALNIIIGRYYGPEAFGIFSLVLAVYYIFSQLAVGGFVFSSLSLVAQSAGDDRQVRQIISTGLALTAALALVVCVAAALLSARIGHLFHSDAVRRGLLWTIPGLWFFAINKVILFSANGLRHMRFYAVGNSLRFVLIVVSLIVLTLLRVDAALLPMCLSTGEVVLLPVLAIYLFRRYPPTFGAGSGFWFRRHLHFGGRAFFSGLLMDINLKVDVILLGYYLSDRAVGIYNFAAMLAIEGLYQFVVMIQVNMNPLLSRLKPEERLVEVKKYVRRATRILCPALAGASCLIALLYPHLTIWLTGHQEFAAGWIYFAILMTGVVIGSCYLPLLFLLNQWGHPAWFMTFLFTIVATNFILNAVLIPVFGAVGSAIGTAISYVMTIVYIKLYTRLAVGISI